MRKPRNRKERVDFLKRKMGSHIIHVLVSMDDREIKGFFNELYPLYKDKEDYQEPEYKTPDCLVCGSETITTWDCTCGHAIIDESDPTLQELKNSGEYSAIREKFAR